MVRTANKPRCRTFSFLRAAMSSKQSSCSPAASAPVSSEPEKAETRGSTLRSWNKKYGAAIEKWIAARELDPSSHYLGNVQEDVVPNDIDSRDTSASGEGSSMASGVVSGVACGVAGDMADDVASGEVSGLSGGAACGEPSLADSGLLSGMPMGATSHATSTLASEEASRVPAGNGTSDSDADSALDASLSDEKQEVEFIVGNSWEENYENPLEPPKCLYQVRWAGLGCAHDTHQEVGDIPPHFVSEMKVTGRYETFPEWKARTTEWNNTAPSRTSELDGHVHTGPVLRQLLVNPSPRSSIPHEGIISNAELHHWLGPDSNSIKYALPALFGSRFQSVPELMRPVVELSIGLWQCDNCRDYIGAPRGYGHHHIQVHLSSQDHVRRSMRKALMHYNQAAAESCPHAYKRETLLGDDALSSPNGAGAAAMVHFVETCREQGKDMHVYLAEPFKRDKELTDIRFMDEYCRVANGDLTTASTIRQPRKGGMPRCSHGDSSNKRNPEISLYHYTLRSLFPFCAPVSSKPGGSVMFGRMGQRLHVKKCLHNALIKYTCAPSESSLETYYHTMTLGDQALNFECRGAGAAGLGALVRKCRLESRPTYALINAFAQFDVMECPVINTFCQEYQRVKRGLPSTDYDLQKKEQSCHTLSSMYHQELRELFPYGARVYEALISTESQTKCCERPIKSRKF